MKKVRVIRPLLKGKVLDPLINGTQQPGTYRWWFHARSFKDLGLTHINPSAIRNEIIEGEKYYALYFGITIKETIRKRLNWHINQTHSYSNIKSGTISTLRHTLCALLLKSLPQKAITDSERIINEFIDANCIVEWTPYPPGTESEIRNDEKKELSLSYWYPLNIQDNKKSDLVKLDYYNKLKRLRKEVRATLLGSK